MSLSDVVFLILAVDVVLVAAIALATATARGRLRRQRGRLRAFAFRGDDAELTARLASAHEAVVLAALVAIGRAPAASASMLGVVAQLVADAAGRVQLAASWACVRILRAHPHLLIVLHDNPSPAVRMAVVRTLRVLAREDEMAALRFGSLAVRVLGDRDESVRRAAAAIIPFFAPAPEMRSALVPALTDDGPDVRHAAAAAMGTTSIGVNGSTLCDVLSQVDEDTSRAMLLGLSRLPDNLPRGVAAIATNRAARHRMAAIRLLGAGRSAPGALVLASLLDDSDRNAQIEAARAAAWLARCTYPDRLDRTLADRLLVVLGRERTPALLVPVIDALAHSGDSRVPAAFLGRMADTQDSIRERLVEATALFGHLGRWSHADQAGARA